jgi:hypothetical protein
MCQASIPCDRPPLTHRMTQRLILAKRTKWHVAMLFSDGHLSSSFNRTKWSILKLSVSAKKKRERNNERAKESKKVTGSGIVSLSLAFLSPRSLVLLFSLTVALCSLSLLSRAGKQRVLIVVVFQWAEGRRCLCVQLFRRNNDT